MAVRCPHCRREYDITLFEFDRSMPCECGKTVTLQHEQITHEALYAQRDEDRKVREIRNMADHIAFLIVGSDYLLIDIEIEKQKLREKVLQLFPNKIGLYSLIYEARFRRLQEQFRGPFS